MKDHSLLPRLDLRNQRAMQLSSMIMHELSSCFNPEDVNKAHHILENLLYSEGVEIITDHARATAGLPQRGQDGWTLEEIRALENRRLEFMLNPIQRPLVSPNEL